MVKRIYRNTLFVTALLLPFLAIVDIIGLKMWKSVGGFESQTYIIAMPQYMQIFWGFAYMIIAVIGLMYWFSTHDLSETIAVVLFPLILIWGGVEDLLVYLFMWTPLENMPWLMNSFVSTTSRIFGFDTVTPGMLILNILIFTTLAVIMVIVLEKINSK